VHPIERLRYVARSSGAPQELMVRETATALGSFADDPSGLVTACRRIVSRQITSGSLWWLCSRMLCAADPIAEARAAVIEIEDDPTPRQLAAALPDGVEVTVIGWSPQVASALGRRGDVTTVVVDTTGEASSFVSHLVHRDIEAYDVVPSGLGAAVAATGLVVLDAGAVGPDAFVAASGSRAAAAVARHAGIPVWLVAGVGRLLPGRVWESLTSRLDEIADPWELEDEIVPLDLVDRVIGPAGPESVAEALARTDCPIAPELFKPDIT
jgi:translation initiation factor 2B subunit (eIF-2B alpha/beta/delta family)